MERITPIRVTSKRQAKRPAKVGSDTLENSYNLRLNKRKATKINDYITFTKAR